MNLTPCHTGPAARTCGFDAALAEVDTDTGELAAVVGVTLDVKLAMLRALLDTVTCISCESSWGRPHADGCEFTTYRDGAAGPVDSRATAGIVLLEGGA